MNPCRLCFCVVFIFLCSMARGETPATQPAMPVRIVAETRVDPAMRLWVVQIDLTDPRVKLRVAPGGPDPDGPGEWQTVLAPVEDIAEREKFDLAFNASFFSVNKSDPWPARGYVKDQPAKAVGWTMTDGQQWSRGNDVWPVLWIDSNRRAHITPTPDVNSTTRQMVAGNCWLLQNGEDRVPKEGMMTVRHPRTAVGIDKTGTTLTVLTVDGRQAGVSIGMTGAELRDELLKYGVVTAINLDGGGSTTLVHRDHRQSDLTVLNKPSDGKQRPVANVVGVTVDE